MEIADPNIRLHNNVVESCKEFNLGEQRILFYVCGFLIKETDTELKPEYEVNAQDYRRTYGLKRNDLYSHFDDVTERITSRKMRIRRAEGKGFHKIVWVHEAEYREGEGKLVLKFSPKMKEYLVGLKKFFTQVGFPELSGFKCKYSVWFLLLTSKWLKVGYREFSIAELREVCGVEEGRYESWNDFKRFVLNRAEGELRAQSKTYFTWEVAGKEGKSVARVRLRFFRKRGIAAPAEAIEAPAENEESNELKGLKGLGIKEDKAKALLESEDLQYLRWVIPVVQRSKENARKKKIRIYNHHSYSLKIIEEERSNFEAEKAQGELALEASNQKAAAAKIKEVEFLQEILKNQHWKYRKQRTLEALEAAPDRDEIIEAFESELEVSNDLFESEYGAKLARDGYRDRGFSSGSAWAHAGPFLEKRLGLQNAFGYEEFERDEGFAIGEREGKVVLLRNGEPVDPESLQ